MTMQLKQKLARIFDDNLETVQWKNYFDYAIMGFILLSTLEVFLSTYDGIEERYGIVLRFIDVLTTIVFTIEVTLRIWCADLLDEEYKGLKGRLKYCLSFYGLIDILSTFPFYLSLAVPINYAAMKSLRLIRVMRLMRVLRIFRYTRSLNILVRAMKASKEQMLVSMQFLFIVTLLHSFILFFVEHEAQPDVYDNGMVSVIWAFMQYIGDPGGFADTPPVTLVGRIIASIIGVLGIAIFAVPAGLIGSAFSDVMNEDDDERKLKEDENRIIHSFKFEQDAQHTRLFAVPRFVALNTILTRKFIATEQIIKAVEQSDCLHLYNLAQAINKQYNPEDKIVVINYKRNTPYGCCIDRGSKITIVSTSGPTEPLTGWFAYHIAKLGGFNYVAKEVEVTPDNPVSYYNITDVNDCTNLPQFLEDINRLSASEGSWVFPVLNAIGLKDRSTQLHFCYATQKHDHTYDDPDGTILDTASFQKMYEMMEQQMESLGLHCDKNDWYVAQPKRNIAHHLECQNVCTLRIECQVAYFNSNSLQVAMDIAKVLKEAFEPEKQMALPPEMVKRPKGKDFGFDDYVD